MTKTPGAIQPPKPTKAERDARKAFRHVDAQKAMTEHEIAQKAFSNNRERLKAERLAREAAGPPPSKTKAPKAKEVKFWRWLRDAIAAKGPAVFLAATIAFLISALV